MQDTSRTLLFKLFFDFLVGPLNVLVHIIATFFSNQAIHATLIFSTPVMDFRNLIVGLGTSL